MNPATRHRGAPFSLLVKPTGAACNLDCSYCFFLSKEVLWGGTQRMDGEVLRQFVRSYLEAQPDGDLTLGWQGGEPTLRGLDFFREAVRLTNEYRRPGQRVQHTIQTNGTLLDDAWGEFLAQEAFLVGLSLDGPPALHDVYRVNKAGRGTYDSVFQGWQVLARHGVETNILCTVNAANVEHPLEVYRHFRDDLGARYVQFIPIVERVESGREADAERGYRDAAGQFVLYRQVGSHVTSRSVQPEAWGDFLVTIFDEWLARDVGTTFVQHFDVMLGAAFGQYSLCVHAPECGTAIAMEHNGDVYSCDHFVEPDYRLGNIASHGFGALLDSPQQRQFGRDKLATLPHQCLRCPVRWACNGGCPKDRFKSTATGEPGLNWLCEGYLTFFTHAQPTIEAMASLIRAGRPPADIMTESSR
ncbi:MAG: anaerobic sulfatase maturase [Propionibacteriaceae bacterium]|nr:anaerobic sulfatase maturase [Micropruina sp.]HBX79968.1 anaerobic sulfatase maturase [Propionibacteriaceae bacterium]HBY22024.1 anaerobic sulfatase maturase [Propionibacteriaceae bacterium]